MHESRNRELNDKLSHALAARYHVCSRMLTYVGVCSRMLAYADVCWRYAGVWCGGSAGVTAKAQQQERAMDRLRLLLEASEKRVLSLLASGLYFCTSKANEVRTCSHCASFRRTANSDALPPCSA